MTRADRPRRSSRARRWLRAVHRDIGYLGVGLTLVYAISGLAVNHIGEWDPNFHNYDRTHVLSSPLPEDPDQAAAVILQELGLTKPVLDTYRADDGSLELTLENSSVFVQTDGRTVVEQGQRPRVLLRLANWLHLNRGKRAWTLIADGYAVLLMTLALTGIFMLGGKKGIRGRGAVLVTAGVALPVLYIALSGGP